MLTRVQVGSPSGASDGERGVGGERERLWGLVTARYAEYNEYARRIGGKREIALVVLTPHTAA